MAKAPKDNLGGPIPDLPDTANFTKPKPRKGGLPKSMTRGLKGGKVKAKPQPKGPIINADD